MGEERPTKWMIDALNPYFECHHGIKGKELYSGKSRYQQIDIVETSFGRCLFLDGKMQSSETDEFIYHEALVHPAMLAHPNPKRVFIVGGGEGATLREVLRHKSVEYALMVDIDEEVVEACRTLLPEWHQGSFEAPRAELKFLDARRHLEETADRYDVIIIDISEPVQEGPAYLLYTKEFYSVVYERLTPHGVISMQAGSTAVGNLECLSAVYQTLHMVFHYSAAYQACIPSFGLPWGFAIASKSLPSISLALLPAKVVDREIPKRITGTLRYYDGETHQGQFALPKYVREELEKGTRIIEDNHPLFTYH